MTLYAPTGAPISERNPLMVIRVNGSCANESEAAKIAAKNRRNYLARIIDRRRRASGRWEK
jgi:hypothetical protein